MLRDILLLSLLHSSICIHIPGNPLLSPSTYVGSRYPVIEQLAGSSSYPVIRQLTNSYVAAPVSYYPLQSYYGAANSFGQARVSGQSILPSNTYPLVNLASPLFSSSAGLKTQQLFPQPFLPASSVQQVQPAPVKPLPYLDPRALCSFCSCEKDFGCGYNCDKCQALCFSCDCEASLGCKYNCDKCEENNTSSSFGSSSSSSSSTSSSSSSGDAELTFQISQDFLGGGQGASSSGGSSSPAYDPIWENQGSQTSGSQTSGSEDECSSLLNLEIELCMWGPSCKHMVSSIFPNCNYSCETCQLTPSSSCVASSGEAQGQPCIFPFIFEGVKYNGCAPLHSASRGVEFWCSTKTDINGYHIRGPYNDIGRYVGFCDSNCPKDLPTFF